MSSIYDNNSYSNLPFPAHINDLLNNMPQNIRQNCVLLTLKKNSIVVRANDVTVNVYLLLSGKMVVLAEFPSGINYSFTEFSPFDMIGELEVIADAPYYAATVKATTNCKVICMTKEVFLDWVRQDTDTAFTICQLVTQKLFIQTKSNRSLLFLDSIDRFVLLLITYYEKRNENSTLILKCTRQKIADEIGVCTKTVNRCIKRLAQNGCILLNHSAIIINKDRYEKLISLMAGKHYESSD